MFLAVPRCRDHSAFWSCVGICGFQGSTGKAMHELHRRLPAPASSSPVQGSAWRRTVISVVVSQMSSGQWTPCEEQTSLLLPGQRSGSRRVLPILIPSMPSGKHPLHLMALNTVCAASQDAPNWNPSFPRSLWGSHSWL